MKLYLISRGTFDVNWIDIGTNLFIFFMQCSNKTFILKNVLPGVCDCIIFLTTVRIIHDKFQKILNNI